MKKKGNAQSKGFESCNVKTYRLLLLQIVCNGCGLAVHVNRWVYKHYFCYGAVRVIQAIYFTLSNFGDFPSDVRKHCSFEAAVDSFYWLAAVYDRQATILFRRKVIHHRHSGFFECGESLSCSLGIIIISTRVLTCS